MKKKIAKTLKQHFKSCDLQIKQEDIKKVHMFEYVRECDNRTLTAYYIILKNGLAYVKNWYTFIHVIKHTDKAFNEFCEDTLHNGVKIEKVWAVNKRIKFEPMYKVPKQEDWLYAEQRYINNLFALNN